MVSEFADKLGAWKGQYWTKMWKRGMWIAFWSRQIFVSHTDVHQRAYTAEMALNNQI